MSRFSGLESLPPSKREGSGIEVNERNVTESHCCGDGLASTDSTDAFLRRFLNRRAEATSHHIPRLFRT